MSLFQTLHAECPACGVAQAVEAVSSVNADRRPDLRDAVLDGSFQAIVCDGCGIQFRLPPRFTYVDFGRGQWFVAHPHDEAARWPAMEAMARDMFEATFGAAAPPLVREIGSQMRCRVTFGWPALREKLLCDAAGLDDVAIELAKASVLRYMPGAPLSDETELRVDSASDSTVTLAWFVIGSEQSVARTTVPRIAVASIGDAWSDLRATFANASFVDVERLIAAAESPR